MTPMQITRYTGPSFSQSGGSSASYDYTGLDEHLARQNALAAARDDKFNALYSGDIQAGVASGNRIRDLVKAVREYSPQADERDPIRMLNPLVRVTNTSSNSSVSSDAGGAELTPEDSGTEASVNWPGRRRPPFV